MAPSEPVTFSDPASTYPHRTLPPLCTEPPSSIWLVGGAPNSRPWPRVTPLRRENFGGCPAVLVEPGCAGRCRAGVRRAVACGCAGAGVLEMLWARSFADVVVSLAGVTPSNSLTPGAGLQGR